MLPIICNNVKNRGGLLGSFKQTPNDPTTGGAVGFSPYVNSISISEKRPIFNPYSCCSGPGFARTFARGRGFVGLFLVVQPVYGSTLTTGPTSTRGCCRKNRKFVGLSFIAPVYVGQKILFFGLFSIGIVIFPPRD